METLFLTIMGNPIGKARPRFYRRGKFVGVYNPQGTEEGRWLWEATQQLGPDFGIISVPIELSFTFHMPIPASLSAKKRFALQHHVKTPDLDNLLKYCLDCLNGILFLDDKQVYKIEAMKLYSENPRTEIYVRWERP